MVAKPKLGDMVIFRSKVGDGVLSPAIVIRTKDTTITSVMEAWIDRGAPITVAGHDIPAPPSTIIPELPDDMTVDLLVLGLAKGYREYGVPYSKTTPTPRTWTDRL